MAILLTGGTGHLSSRVASLLDKANKPFVVAARNVEKARADGIAAEKFDWSDPSSYESPFKHKFSNHEQITSILLVVPQIPNAIDLVKDFIGFAIEKHAVRRFVALGGSTAEPGGPYHGQIWSHLLSKGVDYCILRPTWFMENFNEGLFAQTIKSEDKIYTSCGDGKVPFISVDDIAQVAFYALTDEESHNTSHIIIGSESLTHDEIAQILTKGLGRQIKHQNLSEEDRFAQLTKVGFPEEGARFYLWLESHTAAGGEDQVNDLIFQRIGHQPKTFETFVQENKRSWA